MIWMKNTLVKLAARRTPHRLFCTTGSSSQALTKQKKCYNQYFRLPKSKLLDLASNAELSINQLILVHSALVTNYSHYCQTLISFIRHHIMKTHQPYFVTWIASLPEINKPLLQYYCDHFFYYNENIQEQLLMFNLAHNKIMQIQGGATIQESQMNLWREAYDKNRLKLHNMFKLRLMDFEEFIEYLRIRQADPIPKQEVLKYIQENREIVSVEHTILLLYLTRHYGEDAPKTPLPIQTSDPKSLCLLCEMLTQKAEWDRLDRVLSSIQWKNKGWTYDYIVWMATLFPKNIDMEIQKRCHDAFLKTEITNLSTLFLYIRKVPAHQLSSINTWLCNQSKNILSHFSHSAIVDLLGDLEPQYFADFLEIVMEDCRGKYNWEEINKVYYYAKKWKVESPHTEALRLYVVNGYLSLGTARSRIPTSSYYYKILELVTPDELFKSEIQPFQTWV